MLPVLELYWRSTFCPQPLGDAPTRKAIVDALAMGCIPVFLDRSTIREWAWQLLAGGAMPSLQAQPPNVCSEHEPCAEQWSGQLCAGSMVSHRLPP